MADMTPILIKDLVEQTTTADGDYMVIGGADAKKIKWSTIISLIKAKLTGGVSTILSSNLTASRALVSNASGKVAVSAVTATELGYLDGVTSNLQNQINSLKSSIPSRQQGSIASGSAIAANSKVDITITFPKKFAAVPVVSLHQQNSTGYVFVAVVLYLDASTLKVRFINTTSKEIPERNVTYTAIGVLA